MDISILEDLGLTPAESKVYVALLEVGTSSAGAILEKSRLQNSVVHRALNSLIEKGLISFILEGRRKIYQATDPDSFFQFIDDKRRRFEEILPLLKKKQQFSLENTEATIFKGRRGINEIYNKMLNAGGKEYNTFGCGGEVCHEVMGESWWFNTHAKRIDKKIPSRQVFDESTRDFGEEIKKKPISDVRFLTEEFQQMHETVILGKYVAINIFSQSPYGILIRDRVVVDGYKKNFEFLWNRAKK